MDIDKDYRWQLNLERQLVSRLLANEQALSIAVDRLLQDCAEQTQETAEDNNPSEDLT